MQFCPVSFWHVQIYQSARGASLGQMGDGAAFVIDLGFMRHLDHLREGIRMQGIKGNLIYLLSAMAFMGLFQNCSPEPFDAKGSSTEASSNGGANPLITSSAGDDGSSNQGSSGGNSGSGSGSGSGGGSAGGSGSSGGSDSSDPSAVAYDCDDAFNWLGWKNANTTLRLDLSAGAVRSHTTTDFQSFYRDRFFVVLEGPVRPGAPEGEGLYQRVFASAAGISFRLATYGGGSGFTVPKELLRRDESQGAAEEFLIQSTNQERSRRTRLNVLFDRSVFAATRGYGLVELEVYCKGQLVTKAVQDMRVLDYDMNSRWVKSTSGDTYITVSGNRYLTRKEVPAGLAPEVALNCPLNVAAGGTAKCDSLASGISLLQWFVNGEYLTGADNLASISAQNSQVGRHLIQTRVEYSDGRKARSSVKIIDVK